MDGADDGEISFFSRRIIDGNLISGKTEHASCDVPRLRASQAKGDMWASGVARLKSYTGEEEYKLTMGL